MKTLRRILTATALATLASSGAFAATSTSTYNSALTATPFTIPFTLPNFNPALGTLTGITITITVTTQGAVDVDNIDNVPLTFTNANASAPLTVTGPTGLTPPLMTPLISVTATAGPVAGTAAASGVTPFTGLTGGPTTATFSVPVGDLPAFEGGSSSFMFAAGGGTYSGTETGSGPSDLFFGGSISAQATISVTYTYVIPPALTCSPVTTGTVGVAFSSPAPGITGGTAPFTFSVVGTLPAGLSLNTTTGAITGTPLAPGSFSLKVTDTNGLVSASNCPFTINPPTLTCPATSAGEVGVPFSSPPITVTGGTAPLTFSLAPGSTLPAGLTLNTTTGAITGTPTAMGSFSIQATDANGIATANSCLFTISTITVMCPATSTGFVNEPFSSGPITVTGGTAPYTFSLAPGSTLPAGLTLSPSTGAISGTPTAAGTFSIQVTDFHGLVATVTCPFTIKTLPVCPAFGSGTINVPFSSPAIVPTGGTAPYTFSLAPGSTLPAGLTLNTTTGAISGTPTAAGTFNIQVTDSTGLVSVVDCPFTISMYSPVNADGPFQIRYAANLNIGESYINITNTGANGAPLLGPGVNGTGGSNGFVTPVGNICVNVYAFDPHEELVSCCSCLITPDQTQSLGVAADLTSNPANGVTPTSVTIKLLATLAGTGGSGTSCTNSAATVGTPVIGMTAMGTTLHAISAVPGTYATTETPFTPATLSPAEQNSITSRCASFLGDLSGNGICTSCLFGTL